MAQNEYGGLEHGILQFIGEKHGRISHGDKLRKERFAVEMQQARRHGIKSPPALDPNVPLLFQHHQTQNQRASRTRNQLNWSSGGPGMQAIFLGGSNKKSCGTGVFLPRTEPTDFRSSNKPGFSPVLLPARVVQTLNLNVHELGQQNFKSQQDQPKKIAKKSEEKFEKKKKLDDHAYRSAEIFLPKEWTY